MTELPIERDLRDALSVDPSPAFAAGVRVRIAAEPQRIQHRFDWSMWIGAAGALAAVALVVWLRPSYPPTAASSPLLAGRATVSAMTLPSYASSFVREDVNEHRRSERFQPSGGRDPEILISASESRALLKLIAGPRTWHLDPAPVKVSVAPPVTDLVIEPIVIPPLSIDGGQGVRQ